MYFLLIEAAGMRQIARIHRELAAMSSNNSAYFCEALLVRLQVLKL